jgi:hypothetical protein
MAANAAPRQFGTREGLLFENEHPGAPGCTGLDPTVPSSRPALTSPRTCDLHPPMTPTQRKILYAVSFETLGTLVAAAGLVVMSDASPKSSFILALITATIALCWSYTYNTLFEAWEARQTLRGRSFARRAAHAALF